MPTRYGTAYGATETSLQYRDAAHGGISWVKINMPILRV